MLGTILIYLIEVSSLCIYHTTGADIDVGPSTAVSASVGTSVSLWCKVNAWASGLSTDWVRGLKDGTSLTEDCGAFNTSKYSVNPCDTANHNFTLVISNVQFSDAGGYACGHNGTRSVMVTVTAIAAPQGTRLLNSTADLMVRAQKDTTFLCETKAYPVATVTWEIDGTAVTSGVSHSNSTSPAMLITTTSTLRYMFPKTQGSKNVTCKASNVASGSTPAMASVNVDIIWPVESVFLNCSNSTLHLEGAIVYCQCQTVGGNPAGMVKWTDVRARPSPYALPINATRASNYRVFRCEGYNDVNTHRPVAALRLNVAYPPSKVSITSNPVAPLLAGSSPTLTCEASDKGNPAPNYRWWNSSNNSITGTESAGKSVITVGPLTDRDNGEMYHCEASNYYTINTPSTSPTAAYTLNVEFHPILSTRASPSSTVKEGDDVTLTCDVTKANPTVISYVWSRTRDINNGVHTQASYTINQIQVEQNGTYTCYATAQSSRHGNLVGESSVTLTVQHLRVSVESIPATLENSSVSIHCKPEGIPGSFVYSNWQFLPLTGGQPEDLQRNQNPLVLNNVQHTDAGTYICTASNSQFTKTSNGSLAVKYAAKKDPSSHRVTNLEVSADIEESATLTLYIIAHPKPTSYSWRKINGSLPSTYNQTDLEYESTLRVNRLSDSDYGTYVCSVDNGIGQSVFLFKLERKGKPDAPSNLEMFNVSAISVTVQWISNKDGGYPQTFLVEYKTEDGQWESTSAVTDPGYKQTGLKKVSNLQPDRNYMFRVESRNDYQDGSGKQFASGGFSNIITVKTKVRPIIPDETNENKPSVQVVKDTAIVSWTAPEQGEVTSYGIKYCVKDTLICEEHHVDNSSTSAVINITEGKEYTFTVRVYQGDDVVYEFAPFAQDGDDGGMVGPIVGAVVAAVIAFIVVAVVTLFVIRRRKSLQKGSEVEMSANKEYRRVDDNGSGSDIVPPDSPYAVTHSATENQGGGAAGVEGLYAQPDKKKKQEKRGAEAAAYVPEAGNKEQDPGALYAKPEKKKKKKGKEKDEELTTLYAQPDKGKKKKKKSEAKPAYDEDENPYQNVENKNDPGENPYANVESGGQVVEEKVEDPKDSAKNIGPDGTVYADLAFNTKPKGKNQKDEIIRTEEATEYATIDFKRKAPPT